ncbi:MAG: bifunctional diaminohydroxyphosphoribosylaminopyrimidine deaminase/5-amino-6-(5-phosphoribosylamino)uracil reductase RibD [Gammaproteobacteria bacterium]|nr:bifunctional diaminohydroxyphosphoribosylaminopyrimidine deaminase/5-amino-6-(5-phosphoribosylamino)uracil reductase RibD [Gammaproteobacteria bacterium]
MARAIQLARRGLYTTQPNPRVGCLLVRDGEVVGEGFHRWAGQPHAEPLALAQAGARARGATVYVTLEPCAHQGRTPACADALIAAGVSRVVAAMEDPNPLVAGKGFARLRQAGISVSSGVLEAEAAALNPGFIRRMRHGRPLVRCKLAMSLDGRTAMRSGESRWISGDAARLDVQLLRARSGAIVTGIGTVQADDPAMNVRVGAAQLAGLADDERPHQPLRVVLDPYFEMDPAAQMLRLAGETLVVGLQQEGVTPPALSGAEVIGLPGEGGRIAFAPLLRMLAERGINDVLIEAGSRLAGAALAAGVIDELVIYAAPHLMGDDARGLFHLPDIHSMQQRIGLEVIDLRMVGKDIRITAVPRPG